MPELAIPPDVLQGLAQLLGVGPDYVENLARALDAQEPRLLHARFVAETQLRMPSEVRPQTAPILQALIRLSLGREELLVPLSDYVRDIVASPSLSATEDQRARLSAALVRLLSISSLALSAKAYTVLTENQANYHAARIVTDIRPVFADQADSPTVALIVHSLRIRWGGPNTTQDFYVALDEADLSKMQEILARAQVKAATLRRSFEHLKFPVISEELT